jgi:hypothetical protein
MSVFYHAQNYYGTSHPLHLIVGALLSGLSILEYEGLISAEIWNAWSLTCMEHLYLFLYIDPSYVTSGMDEGDFICGVQEDV